MLNVLRTAFPPARRGKGQLMQAPTPPLEPPPGLASSYVLCYFQGPGVPWSEDPLGTSFQSWADKNLSSNAEQEQFYWLWHPGEQMMEFVTAQNTRPGQGPLREALSGLREASG